jgi:general L-amino acid transport system substrate-binding protein
MRSFVYLLAVFVSLSVFAPVNVDARDLLKKVQKRGLLRCGVRSVDFPGFLVRQPDGSYVGFDADFCRGIAAAIFANANQVQFVPVPLAERFQSVREGGVDVYIGGTTQTLSRDALVKDGGEGTDFGPVFFYDGQSFLISAAITVNPNDDPVSLLDGKTVCVRENTTSETNLHDFALDHNITIIAFTAESAGSSGDLFTDFEQSKCDAISSDRAGLFSRQPGVTRPSTLMSATISEEPLAPVVAMGAKRERFAHVVRWVVYATFAAEELGLNSGNVGVIPANAEGRRLLGYTPGLGEKLGLGNDWAFQVIAHVGNYQEIYERNLSGLPRGKNTLPSAGGLLFSPPFQ